MKILITGIRGMLGTELAGVLAEGGNEITGIDLECSQANETPKIIGTDLCDFNLTYETISKQNPDIVIHCAAFTNVDECEKNPDLAYKMNAIASRNVAIACQRFDTSMVYISTDYVFSRPTQTKQGFTEFDNVNPVGEYSKSKYAGECYVKDILNKFYIVRPSWLFGHKRSNFVSQIAEAFSNGKPVKQVTDMISSPTNVKDLAHAVSFLIKTGCYGTYHITNSGWQSRYDVACYIADLMGAPKILIEKCTLSDLKLNAPRPSFSGLNNYVWKLNGFKPLRPWQESIKEFLSEKGFI